MQRTNEARFTLTPKITFQISWNPRITTVGGKLNNKYYTVCFMTQNQLWVSKRLYNN